MFKLLLDMCGESIMPVRLRIASGVTKGKGHLT